MFVKEKYSAITSLLPHTFSDLMEMYEANYIRLRMLCGDIRRLPDVSVSALEGSVPVQLSVVERANHTTSIMLTYNFDIEDENAIKRPDLMVRVYHDSRQAEVISRQCNITGATLRPWEKDVDSLLMCRWRLNRFLFKWSGYLYRQGHDFTKQPVITQSDYLKNLKKYPPY